MKTKLALIVILCLIFSIGATSIRSNAYTNRFPYILPVVFTWSDCHGAPQEGILEIIVYSPSTILVEVSWNVPTGDYYGPGYGFCFGLQFDFISGFIYDTSNGHVGVLTPPVWPSVGIADQYLTASGQCCWSINAGDYLVANFQIWYGLYPPFFQMITGVGAGIVGS